MRLVLFVLCSAVFHVKLSLSHLRQIKLLQKPEQSWKKARQACQEEGLRLITLYDNDDVKFATRIHPGKSLSWIGLHHKRSRNSTWSDDSNYTICLSKVNLPNGGQMCEAIDGDNWIGCNCSDVKPFMCHRQNKDYILVEEEKTWCQALQHCRDHHSDLVSISSLKENKEVIKRGKNRSFWIGLLHDEWAWEDNGCSTFREWSTDALGEDEYCAVVSPQRGLVTSTCETDNNVSVLCSKGSVRIKVIREKLTWEQAFDYCNANHSRLLWIESYTDQLAVTDWLRYFQEDGLLWLGLRQSRVFGFWFWSSDRMVEYNNWKDGVVPELPMSHHCGAIAQRDNNSWTNQDCRLQLPFLCEVDIYTKAWNIL